MEMWKKIINDILRRLDALENNVVIKKITIPADGYLVLKEVTSDPSTPKEGEMWVNKTTWQIKACINGVIKVFTVS